MKLSSKFLSLILIGSLTTQIHAKSFDTKEAFNNLEQSFAKTMTHDAFQQLQSTLKKPETLQALKEFKQALELSLDTQALTHLKQKIESLKTAILAAQKNQTSEDVSFGSHLLKEMGFFVGNTAITAAILIAILGIIGIHNLANDWVDLMCLASIPNLTYAVLKLILDHPQVASQELKNILTNSLAITETTVTDLNAMIALLESQTTTQQAI